MNISQYREKLIAKIKESQTETPEETVSILNLAGNKDQIKRKLKAINDGASSPEEVGAAIDALNAISIFSPVLRTQMPEFVNALRGQLTSPHQAVRRRAFGTLSAMKDEVAQDCLLREIESDKNEEDRLVPTAMAIAMLGHDEKALPQGLLRKIAQNRSDKSSQLEAIRHMQVDDTSVDTLKEIMDDVAQPVEARTMIKNMIHPSDPEPGHE